MKITRQMLIEEGYCADTPGKLEQYVPPEGLTPLQVCDCDLPVDDKIWTLVRRYGEYQPLTDRQYRLLACKWAREECARAAWDDARSLRAIDVSEKFADGLASKKELAAALDAAAWAAWDVWDEAWEVWDEAAAAAARSEADAADAAEVAALDAALDAASEAPDAPAEAQVRYLADIRAVLTGELFAEEKS